MHFKTVHVNRGWMTTADESGVVTLMLSYSFLAVQNSSIGDLVTH